MTTSSNPFAGSELLARLARRDAALARQAMAMSPLPNGSLRDLLLDELRMELRRGSRTQCRLSRTEFSAVADAGEDAGSRRHPPSAREPARPARMDGRSLDVHMSNLRRKIGEGYIRTVRGVGYAVERQ